MSVIFDQAGAMDRVAYDKDLLVELFDIAFQDADERLITIENAISSGNAKALAEAAHAMKSAFGNIGAMSCHAAAFNLENKGKSGSMEGSSELLEDFKNQLILFKRIAESFKNI
jgi:HPt (histidine-containing phosphotransfer) domain-containing protein